MPDPRLSQMLAAVAAMLLRPPDAGLLSAFAASGGGEITPAQARQDFYDVLCIPQSGRYISPYAHVLSHGHLWGGKCWNFPPPRYDGGDNLAEWYEAVGFNPMQLDADPMLRGPHRALDQVGFIFAYLAGLVASEEAGQPDSAAANSVISVFLAENLGDWVDRFYTLLGDCDSPYLHAVAGALEDAIMMVRSRYLLASTKPAVSKDLPDPAAPVVIPS